jgi:hypothetical protein
VGASLDLLLLRLQAFTGYVTVGPGGDPFLYAGPLGPLRRLADSAPFEMLYDHRSLAAFAVALVLALVLILKARRAHLARWRAARMRLKGRWELHLAPAKTVPSDAPLTPGDALSAALAWPLAYLFSGWIIGAARAGLSLAASLQTAPGVGTLVENPQAASACAATAAAAFVLWRRRSMRSAAARMLQGKIRH